MGAMAAVVARGIELVGRRPEHGAIGGEHLASADQLVVAGERRVVGIVGRVPELARERAGRGSRVAPVIGEGRVLRPDPGVDDADDHALAREAAVVRAAVDSQAHEFRAAVGLRLTHHVVEDAHDALLQLDGGDLRRRQQGRITVERDRVVVQLVLGRDLGLAQRLVVGRAQERLVLADGGVAPIQLLAGGRLRRREPGDTAVVCRDGLRGHDDDVGFGAFLRQDRSRRRHRQRDGHDQCKEPKQPRSPHPVSSKGIHVRRSTRVRSCSAGGHLPDLMRSANGGGPFCARQHRRGTVGGEG